MLYVEIFIRYFVSNIEVVHFRRNIDDNLVNKVFSIPQIIQFNTPKSLDQGWLENEETNANIILSEIRK